MTRFSYRSGGFPTLVTNGGVLSVVPGHEDLLKSLYGETLAVGRVVEALMTRGWSSIPDFACVSLDAGIVRVLVRGDMRIELGGETLDGGGVTTWLERQFDLEDIDVILIRLGAADGESEIPESQSLPIQAGIVYAGSISYGTPDSAAKAAVDNIAMSDAEAEDVESPSVIESAADAEPPIDAIGPIAIVEDVVHAEDEEDSDEEVIDEVDGTELETPAEVEVADDSDLGDGPAPEGEAVLEDPGATITDVDDLEFDMVFGATIPGRRPEDAAVRVVAEPDFEPAPEPEPEPELHGVLGDHDGHTVSASGLRKLRQTDTGHVPAAAPVVQVEMDNGQTYTVTRTAVVGRSPRTTQAAGADLPTLVIVDDPFVSSTHLEISVSPDRVTVTDLSTNGTLYASPGAKASRLAKGVAVAVVDGGVLTLSENLKATLRIEEPVR